MAKYIPLEESLEPMVKQPSSSNSMNPPNKSSSVSSNKSEAKKMQFL
jgi:hypothetical protein